MNQGYPHPLVLAMAARNKKDHLDDAQEEARMDMTPLIDVVFLLIIFFLCIDFRILEAKLPAWLPTDRGSIDVPQEPREQLRVKILVLDQGTKTARPFQPERYLLEGHRVSYMVGPKAVQSLRELGTELDRIQPDSWVTGPQGRRQLMPVEVEPGPGTVYADVAPTVDTILAAGFGDVHFGGGRGK